MARRPQSQQGDTLRQIQESSFRLFGRHGYDGVSVDMVAKAAGITKAALYWHYPSKEALYTDCLRALHALFQEHIFSRLAARDEPDEQMLALFEGMAQLMRDRRIREGVAGYWLESSTAELAQARRAQKRFEQEAAQLVAGVIDRGVERGSLQFDTAAADMAQATISIMESIVLPLRRLSVPESVRLVSTLAHSFFLAHARDRDLSARALALDRQ